MFHFSSPLEGATRKGCPAAEIIDNGADDGDRVGARSTEALPEIAGTLSVQLGHMGVAIAITADGSGPLEGAEVKRRAAPASGEDAISFRLHGAAQATLRRTAQGERVEAAGDPVVEKLARALDAAERSNDAYAGLYADALRLATIVRILSGHDAFEAEAPAPTARRAPPQPRPAAGLPKWRLKRVVAFVDERLGEPVTLADMAAAAGLSRMYFAAQFRATTGVRPHEYLLRRRVEKAQEILQQSQEPLAQIALAVGFQTQAHFTTVFRRFVGETPSRWRAANPARG